MVAGKTLKCFFSNINGGFGIDDDDDEVDKHNDENFDDVNISIRTRSSGSSSNNCSDVVTIVVLDVVHKVNINKLPLCTRDNKVTVVVATRISLDFFCCYYL